MTTQQWPDPEVVCSACNGAKVIGTPGVPCRFCAPMPSPPSASAERKLVPIEPSGKMIGRGRAALYDGRTGQEISEMFVKRCWASMVDAAPVAPGQAPQPKRQKLRPMQNEEDQEAGIVRQWYFDCDGHYIDVALDEGKYSIFFRDRATGNEGWLDQADTAPIPAPHDSIAAAQFRALDSDAKQLGFASALDAIKSIPAPAQQPRQSPDEGVIRHKFFKLLSDAERLKVFSIFLDLPDVALAEVRSHATEVKLLDSLLRGRFRAQGGNTSDKSSVAAPVGQDIPTWQECIKDDPRTYAMDVAMKDEIAALRAALAAKAPQQPCPHDR